MGLSIPITMKGIAFLASLTSSFPCTGKKKMTDFCAMILHPIGLARKLAPSVVWSVALHIYNHVVSKQGQVYSFLSYLGAITSVFTLLSE